MRKLLTDVCKSWRYPGGEIGVRATGDCAGELLARIQSSDDLMRLLMYLDAVDKAGGDLPDSVFIPYLPYARQDRVATDGDPFAIGAFAQALATSGIREVSALDVHSSVATEAFEANGIKLESVQPVRYLAQFLLKIEARSERIWLVAPDAGAAEKVALYASDLLVQGVIQCEKLRDPVTGKLSGFRVASGPSKLPEGSSLIVVDDICDGGGTFIGIASALAAHFNWHHPLHLFTTHGIYSHPDGVHHVTANGGYRTIGSTDSFLHGKTSQNLITIPI